MENHMRDCLAVMSVPFIYIYIYIYSLFDSLLHSADCEIANNEKNYCTIMSVTGKKIENLHCGNCMTLVWVLPPPPL